MSYKQKKINPPLKVTTKTLWFVNLTQPSSDIFKIIIKYCNKTVISGILEIILNTLVGNIPVSEKLKQHLIQSKKSLRNVVKRPININSKRKQLIRLQDPVQKILQNFLSQNGQQ